MQAFALPVARLPGYGKRWQAMDVVIAQATSKRESEGEIGQHRPQLRKDRPRLRKVAKDSAFFFSKGEYPGSVLRR